MLKWISFCWSHCKRNVVLLPSLTAFSTAVLTCASDKCPLMAVSIRNDKTARLSWRKSSAQILQRSVDHTSYGVQYCLSALFPKYFTRGRLPLRIASDTASTVGSSPFLQNQITIGRLRCRTAQWKASVLSAQSSANTQNPLFRVAHCEKQSHWEPHLWQSKWRRLSIL